MKIPQSIFAIGFIGSLVLGPAIGPVFAANKAGGACTKAGATAKVGKTTLTCKKVDKKLVWMSGAAAAVVEDLSKDTSISPQSALSSADVCKIADITFDNPPGNASSGFPRSTNMPPSTRNARVLVLPVSFSDFKFDDGSYDLIKLAYQKIVKLYTSMSYGRVTIAPTFPAKGDWIDLSSTIGENGLHQDAQDVEVVVRRLLTSYAATHSLANYDIVDLVTKNDSPMYNLQINLAMEAGTYRYGTNLPIAATLNAGIVGRYRTHAHELAHAWLGLEDLYGFGTLEKYFGGWDLMDSAGGVIELSSWSRWLAGWVTDAQVRCLNVLGTTTHFVSALSANVPTPKMIVTKLSNSSALVVELRTPTEFDLCEQSVIVYVVDTKYWSGTGPIRLRGTLTASGGVITTDGVTVTLGKMNSAGAVITVAKN